MKKIGILLLTVLLILNLGLGYANTSLVKNEVNISENIFTDIENHWAIDNIVRLYNIGGINGYPDGTFRPDRKITKAEFLALAIKSVAQDAIQPAQEGVHWGRPYFDWAYSNDIIDAVDLDELTWNNPIIRYDMAKIIVRALENIIEEPPIEVTGIEKIIADYEAVNESETSYYVKQAFAKGILTGKTIEGLFAGSDTGTRAEATTLILRLLDPDIRKEVSLEENSKEKYLTASDELTQEFTELFIQGVLGETNYQREILDIHPLERDDLLIEIAQYKSDDMVMLANAGEPQEVYFSHESPTYGDLRDLVNLFELSQQKSVGENLAWMPYQPIDAQPEILGKQAVLFLKDSSSHYEAMINENYDHIGIGVSYRYYESYNSGYLFVTQTFSD